MTQVSTHSRSAGKPHYDCLFVKCQPRLVPQHDKCIVIADRRCRCEVMASEFSFFAPVRSFILCVGIRHS